MSGKLEKLTYRPHWFVKRQREARTAVDVRHAHTDTTAASPVDRWRPWLRFLLHLGEMTLAMMLGMYLLDMPLGMAMTAIGYSGPVASALLMTVTMTVPMVVWMRVRGHTWERAREMGAAMVIPSIALIVLSLFGVIAQSGLANAVMIPMIPAMVAAMLYRRTEYAHCGSHREAAPIVS